MCILLICIGKNSWHLLKTHTQGWENVINYVDINLRIVTAAMAKMNFIAASSELFASFASKQYSI